MLTPCNHAFCKECLERMLRVQQKSDVDCPICKCHYNRRSLRSVASLMALAAGFREVAAVYERITGKAWDDPDDDEDKGGKKSKPAKSKLSQDSAVLKRKIVPSDLAVTSKPDIFVLVPSFNASSSFRNWIGSRHWNLTCWLTLCGWIISWAFTLHKCPCKKIE